MQAWKLRAQKAQHVLLTLEMQAAGDEKYLGMFSNTTSIDSCQVVSEVDTHKETLKIFHIHAPS